MSGDARQAVEDMEAKNRNKKTSLHHENPDEIHSEKYDVPMSQLGQPSELRNGDEPRRCGFLGGILPYAPTESEEQQNQLKQLPNGREPRRRWITKTEWIHYIQEDPQCPSLRNRGPSDVSIFRVPKPLKHKQREAYVPVRVSLGPYHHGSAELPEMGHHKGRALRILMKRFKINLNEMDFANRAMEEILTFKKEIRVCYEENIDCDGETLARMLCLDGCFLLEVLITLCRNGEYNPYDIEYYDPIFRDKFFYSVYLIVKDIFILENQIPFIVLQKLLLQLKLNSGVDIDEQKLLDDVVEDIVDYLDFFDHTNLDIRQGCRHHPHLLSFLQAAIAFPPLNADERVDEGECNISIGCCSRQYSIRLQCKSKERNDTPRIPHAVELRNAGIKISALQEGGINRIKFDENSATIFLPPISIVDRTERVFRNLIAYEMCKPSGINYVSSYAALMNDLIDTEQDVALMRRMGVLKSWIGSDKEIADLFNGLDVTVSTNFVFDNLAGKVTEHYNNEIKVQIGKLVQDHFSSPWTALALMAASVMLVLTMLQTIYTIISTYKKK